MQTAVRLGAFGDADEHIPDLLDRVAEAGYDGVVFGGLAAAQLKPVAASLGRTGLDPVAARVPLDRLQAEREQVVRDLRTIGCERVLLPALHGGHFGSEGSVARMATRLSALGGRLAADSRQLCYRPGSEDFATLDGDRTGFDVLAARAGEGLAFELDLATLVAADRDPVGTLEAVPGRVPLLGLGDGAVSLDDDVVEGILDAAAAAGAEWLVVDPRTADESLPAEGDRLDDAEE